VASCTKSPKARCFHQMSLLSRTPFHFLLHNQVCVSTLRSMRVLRNLDIRKKSFLMSPLALTPGPKELCSWMPRSIGTRVPSLGNVMPSKSKQKEGKVSFCIMRLTLLRNPFSPRSCIPEMTNDAGYRSYLTAAKVGCSETKSKRRPMARL
jgi:hypothetical protein